eukprot:CAMPEP_0184694498 /NCGR_PEP_ID=MMETSP0313-20130426/2431_1 /TAXON_ID=2792 /ORGANISM="Porphyridium aerugineum, Strain SAG 1380-2" /LENGTH=106 /DNA_ID=CAMNT_0027152793 /DNA_START=844 /DNA_END=1167 /DNA_ORIENTATION=-
MDFHSSSERATLPAESLFAVRNLHDTDLFKDTFFLSPESPDLDEFCDLDDDHEVPRLKNVKESEKRFCPDADELWDRISSLNGDEYKADTKAESDSAGNWACSGPP